LQCDQRDQETGCRAMHQRVPRARQAG
jgi:hypothetical protein